MTDRSAALKPREDAGRATAENGVVILDGPNGIAVTMTADAAAKTADSLQEAARQAREHPASDEVARDAPGDEFASGWPQE
ncbi:hypothetical protein WKW79_33005 [Variovorax robiniae]|uniref:Uncharacterized protein n=1 Tax=Variovorax robiniae TaxID=1836199 RepID=A0ABU8XIA8_9BURK